MRLVRSLAVLLTALLLPALAAAHGPTRQKIAVTAEAPAAPSEVWAVIGIFRT